jgi:hypothetical protein
MSTARKAATVLLIGAAAFIAYAVLRGRRVRPGDVATESGINIPLPDWLGEAAGFIKTSLGVGNVDKGAFARSIQTGPGRKYLDYIEAVGKQYGLPPLLLASVAFHESEFNPNALSKVGARGMFQFMPATWAEEARKAGLADRQPEDWQAAAVVAARYLSALYKRGYGRNRVRGWFWALTAYNAGMGIVDKLVDGRIGWGDMGIEAHSYANKIMGAIGLEDGSRPR